MVLESVGNYFNQEGEFLHFSFAEAVVHEKGLVVKNDVIHRKTDGVSVPISDDELRAQIRMSLQNRATETRVDEVVADIRSLVHYDYWD